MPLLAPGAIGIIEMERKPSRVEAFLENDADLDCAGQLMRLAHTGKGGDIPLPDVLPDGSADEVLLADTVRLAAELEAEYQAMRAAIENARS